MTGHSGSLPAPCQPPTDQVAAAQLTPLPDHMKKAEGAADMLTGAMCVCM